MGLPLLEGLLPKSAKAGPADLPPFAVFLRQGNGVAQETSDGEPERYWPSLPIGALAAGDLASSADRALSELTGLEPKLSIVRGAKFAFPGNGCGHSGGGNQCLTAAQVSAMPSGNESLSLGESIDNRIVRDLCPPGTEPLTLYVGRKPGYLDEVLSYRNAYELRAAENNPFEVYQNLFALSGLDPDQLAELRARRKSVNDLVRADLQALLSSGALSGSDLVRVEQHLDAVRDLELGIVCGLGDGKVAELDAMQANVTNDDYFEDVARLQIDLAALAMACGVTRAATIQLGNGNDGTLYWIDGVKQKSFHKISHRIDSDGAEGPPIPDADVLHHKIDRKLLGLYRYLVETFDSYDLGGATLLDRGVLVMTNDLSNKWHSYSNVPFLLAGSAGGALVGGRYVDVAGATHNVVLNTIGAACGVKNATGGPLDDFGDPSLAKGVVSELLA